MISQLSYTALGASPCYIRQGRLLVIAKKIWMLGIGTSFGQSGSIGPYHTHHEKLVYPLILWEKTMVINGDLMVFNGGLPSGYD